MPIAEMTGDDDNDTNLLKLMATEAEQFLESFKWHRGILDGYFGLGVGGVAAVFLFHIKPADTVVDDYVWIVVGDIPPLYVTIEDAPNPACALDAYIGAMEEWADAALAGRSVLNLVPVDAEPSQENGAALKKRLDFLDKEILSAYRDDLK